MRLTIIFGLLILFNVSFRAAAQDGDEKPAVHPIDKAQEQCLKTHRGTMPRAKCYSNASEAWEKAVTQDYQKLMKQLSSELQKVLQSEQAAWEKYRGENQDFVIAKYGKRRGTGYISVRIVLLMKPNKERALELESRFEN